ncbi:MAG: LysE family translocator [Silicimonas sp.]|nr:LysE family translocator [Silicimonas sp.]
MTGVMSPGPGVALILGIAVSEGRRSALMACLGIGCAAILLAVATVVGLAAIWSEVAGLLTIVRLAGATYLGWLAWTAFRKAINPPPPPTARRESGRSSILQGFLMQLINPKALMFWVAIAAVSGLNLAPLPVVVLFVIGAFAVSFAGHGIWAVALSSHPFRILYARARRWIEGLLGCFFALVAFKLATAEE